MGRERLLAGAGARRASEMPVAVLRDTTDVLGWLPIRLIDGLPELRQGRLRVGAAQYLVEPLKGSSAQQQAGPRLGQALRARAHREKGRHLHPGTLHLASPLETAGFCIPGSY